jgi:putative sporulation protein YyaC
MEQSSLRLDTRYDEPDSARRISKFLQNSIKDEKYLIMCIGTDISSGDSFGPITGTILENSALSAPVHGTLEKTINATNIEDMYNFIKRTYIGYKIIAIDACVSNDESDIGNIKIYNGRPVSTGPCCSTRPD